MLAPMLEEMEEMAKGGVVVRKLFVFVEYATREVRNMMDM